MMPAAEDAEIAIFPLSNVVLFPRISTPLHLFEPRYRQLAREVLEGDRRIGMTVVRPEFADDTSGAPPLYPVGCVGRITEHERMPDGRYNVVLLGEQRFRIVEEIAGPEERLYRVARVDWLEDEYPDADRDRIARLRAHIVENVGVLARETQPDTAASLDPELFAGVDDETLVNLLCNAFAMPVEDKQALLEADVVADRYARLASLLSFQRAELSESSLPDRERMH
jgi:Lon protease-like protein